MSPVRRQPPGWPSRFIEDGTGWSIRKFVRTARRCRTIEIRAGHHTAPRYRFLVASK
jgi:hypothetical protein